MGGPKRQTVQLTIAIVALGAAITLFALQWGGDEGLPNEYWIDGVCLACKQDAAASFTSSEQEPLECPHCGEQAVYSWWICLDCKRKFVPRLVRSGEGGPPRRAAIPVCVECKSIKTAGYIKEFPDHEPSGVARLPKWP